MRFKRHSELADKHSFLSPSKYAWLRYDDEKIAKMFNSHLAAMRGTREHKFAQEAIELGFKQPDTQKTINLYINDCIGWRMTPEVPLMYSPNCFGHADALGYRETPEDEVYTGTLRVSDYKSGRSPTKVDQLEVYSALFCLEYEKDPFKTRFEHRVYQNNQVRLYDTDSERIFFNMRRIITADQIIENLKRESLS